MSFLQSCPLLCLLCLPLSLLKGRGLWDRMVHGLVLLHVLLPFQIIILRWSRVLDSYCIRQSVQRFIVQLGTLVISHKTAVGTSWELGRWCTALFSGTSCSSDCSSGLSSIWLLGWKSSCGGLNVNRSPICGLNGDAGFSYDVPGILNRLLIALLPVLDVVLADELSF